MLFAWLRHDEKCIPIWDTNRTSCWAREIGFNAARYAIDRMTEQQKNTSVINFSRSTPSNWITVSKIEKQRSKRFASIQLKAMKALIGFKQFKTVLIIVLWPTPSATTYLYNKNTWCKSNFCRFYKSEYLAEPYHSESSFHSFKI